MSRKAITLSSPALISQGLANRNTKILECIPIVLPGTSMALLPLRHCLVDSEAVEHIISSASAEEAATSRIGLVLESRALPDDHVSACSGAFE